MSVPNAALSVTRSLLSPGGFGSSTGQVITPQIVGTVSSASVATAFLTYAQVDISWPRTLTGIGYYSGGTLDAATAATPALYNSAGTQLVSLLGHTGQTGTNSPQLLPFGVPYAAIAGTYFLAFSIRGSGTWLTSTLAVTPWDSVATFGTATSTISIPTFQNTSTAFPIMFGY